MTSLRLETPPNSTVLYCPPLSSTVLQQQLSGGLRDESQQRDQQTGDTSELYCPLLSSTLLNCHIFLQNQYISVKLFRSDPSAGVK